MSLREHFEAERASLLERQRGLQARTDSAAKRKMLKVVQRALYANWVDLESLPEASSPHAEEVEA